jgi:hypothetical protein
VCAFALPDGATSTLDDRQADCDKQCADAVQALRPPPLAPPPPVPPAPPKPVPARTVAAPTSNGGGMALCCDGSPSPSCACPGHRGCCSHHGGVCGCTN